VPAALPAESGSGSTTQHPFVSAVQPFEVVISTCVEPAPALHLRRLPCRALADGSKLQESHPGPARPRCWAAPPFYRPRAGSRRTGSACCDSQWRRSSAAASCALVSCPRFTASRLCPGLASVFQVPPPFLGADPMPHALSDTLRLNLEWPPNSTRPITTVSASIAGKLLCSKRDEQSRRRENLPAGAHDHCFGPHWRWRCWKRRT